MSLRYIRKTEWGVRTYYIRKKGWNIWLKKKVNVIAELTTNNVLISHHLQYNGVTKVINHDLFYLAKPELPSIFITWQCCINIFNELNVLHVWYYVILAFGASLFVFILTVWTGSEYTSCPLVAVLCFWPLPCQAGLSRIFNGPLRQHTVLTRVFSHRFMR